jgi:hypothetical protein
MECSRRHVSISTQQQGPGQDVLDFMGFERSFVVRPGCNQPDACMHSFGLPGIEAGHEKHCAERPFLSTLFNSRTSFAAMVVGFLVGVDER